MAAEEKYDKNDKLNKAIVECQQLIKKISNPLNNELKQIISRHMETLKKKNGNKKNDNNKSRHKNKKPKDIKKVQSIRGQGIVPGGQRPSKYYQPPRASAIAGLKTNPRASNIMNRARIQKVQSRKNALNSGGGGGGGGGGGQQQSKPNGKRQSQKQSQQQNRAKQWANSKQSTPSMMQLFASGKGKRGKSKK